MNEITLTDVRILSICYTVSGCLFNTTEVRYLDVYRNTYRNIYYSVDLAMKDQRLILISLPKAPWEFPGYTGLEQSLKPNMSCRAGRSYFVFDGAISFLNHDLMT